MSTITEEAAARRERVLQATAYVQSRFFPPLPSAYGELAVSALERIELTGLETRVLLPRDLNPLPRGYSESESGELSISAGELVSALRLEHLVPCQGCLDTDCEECY